MIILAAHVNNNAVTVNILLMKIDIFVTRTQKNEPSLSPGAVCDGAGWAAVSRINIHNFYLIILGFVPLRNLYNFFYIFYRSILS